MIEKFTFFIVIGALLTFVGLIKIITGTPNKERKIVDKISKNPNGFITCKFCKAYNYPNALRCHHCGRRIK